MYFVLFYICLLFAAMLYANYLILKQEKQEFGQWDKKTMFLRLIRVSVFQIFAISRGIEYIKYVQLIGNQGIHIVPLKKYEVILLVIYASLAIVQIVIRFFVYKGRERSARLNKNYKIMNLVRLAWFVIILLISSLAFLDLNA